MFARQITVGFIPRLKSWAFSSNRCNDLLYAACHLVETTDREFRIGFVHVPFSHGQAAVRDEGEPSVSLEAMEQGLRVGLEVAVDDGSPRDSEPPA
ncbi:pyrrolidone-carboxylate peptidase [Natronococcus amylolyticus DSM 10524]|uniref:Pyrrolidone-carboxylate peptidase n=1 Tax=Natronococcus amylolyticus DSM 10524 TaxID=1227497 RepID=L9XJ48_9EURY|nr:pyrrolidone-carboxylate peptidase [Natronococcus amylolyticus DSM 10524]